MQSQTMGQPLFSVPQSIEAKSDLYTKTKEKLGVSTVKEMQEVEWEKLVEAYRTVDTRTGLGELAMVDGEVFDENWRSRFEFKGSDDDEKNKGPELMIGNTGREGSVIKAVMMGSPKSNPQPTVKTLSTSLSTILPSEKAEDILKIYNIPPTPSHELQTISEPSQFTEGVLTIIEDLIFYKGTAEFIALAQNKNPEVKFNQYIFKQKNPFSTAGVFQGVAVHALDLAYLHGDERIFSGVADREGEVNMMREMQREWVEFVYGYGAGKGTEEKGGVRTFGPDGKLGMMGIQEFREERRYDRWKIFEGLSEGEMEGVAGVILGIYGGLVGEG